MDELGKLLLEKRQWYVLDIHTETNARHSLRLFQILFIYNENIENIENVPGCDESIPESITAIRIFCPSKF